MSKRATWTRTAGRWAVNACFWVAAIMVFGAAMSTEAIDNAFLAIIAIGAMGFVATLVHEIGHAWAAHRRGAVVTMIVALPFGYSPTSRQFSVIQNRKGGDIAGYVSYHFPDDCGTRRDEMAIAAAGPVWNLACAALLILSLWASSGPASHTSALATEPAIIARQEGEVGSRPAALPSQAEIDRVIARERARLQNEGRIAALESLIQILIVVSIASGVLNLLPYRGSDCSIIIEHWHWLKGKA